MDCADETVADARSATVRHRSRVIDHPLSGADSSLTGELAISDGSEMTFRINLEGQHSFSLLTATGRTHRVAGASRHALC
jgi:hypothetical protein